MKNWNYIDKGAKTRARQDGRGWKGAHGIDVIQQKGAEKSSPANT